MNDNQDENAELPPIVTLTDPRAEVLAMVSERCNIPPSEQEAEAADKMVSILEYLGDNAVAIAAPQIAVPKRIFSMRLNDGTYETFFNPIIKKRSTAQSKKPEGCLSVEQASVRISRPRSVTVEYIDISGQLLEKEFHDLHARAICHEIDHLNGRIIMEHMSAEIERNANKLALKTKQKEFRTDKRRAANKLARRSRKRNRS